MVQERRCQKNACLNSKLVLKIKKSINQRIIWKIKNYIKIRNKSLNKKKIKLGAFRIKKEWNKKKINLKKVKVISIKNEWIKKDGTMQESKWFNKFKIKRNNKKKWI